MSVAPQVAANEHPPEADGTPALPDELQRLLPLVRVCEGRFSRGIVRISREGIALAEGRACDLTEDACLGRAPLVGRNPRFYPFGEEGRQDRVERIIVQQVGRVTPSSEYRRFVIRTAQTTDAFWVAVTECRNVWRVLEAMLGERLEFEDQPRLTRIERLMRAGALSGAVLLGLGLVAWLGIGWQTVGTVAIGCGGAALGMSALILLGVAVACELAPRVKESVGGAPRRAPRAGPSRRPFHSRPLGWAVKCVGVLYFFLVFPGALAEFAGSLKMIPGLWHLAWLGLALPGWCALFIGYRLSRQVFAPDQPTGSTRPVLYLRSFADDDVSNFQPDSLLAELHGISRPQGRGSLLRSLNRRFIIFHPVRVVRMLFNVGADSSEEVLALAFRRCGPFVAIGRPGEWLPTAGADRMYVEDARWREVVLDYLTRCKAVVLQPSKAGNILWEIDQALATVEPCRILFSMINFGNKPPDDYEDFRIGVESRTRVSLPRLVPYLAHPCFVYFDRDGSAHIQELCRLSPLFWSVSGNSVDVRRTFHSFIQGLDGSPRVAPIQPLRHRGHGIASLIVSLAVLLAMFYMWEGLVWLQHTFGFSIYRW